MQICAILYIYVYILYIYVLYCAHRDNLAISLTTCTDVEVNRKISAKIMSKSSVNKHVRSYDCLGSKYLFR